MKKKQSYQIQFEAIDLVSKELKFPSEPIVGHEINFHYNISIKLSTELKKVLVITDVYVQNKKNNNENLASFKLFCVFEVSQFEEVFTLNNKNTYDIPAELEIILKSAGLSTIRGIIYSELRGTYLQKAVLPLIDLAPIILDRKRNEKKLQS